MSSIEIYINDEDILVVRLKNNSSQYKLYDNDAANYIEQLYSEKPLKIVENQEDIDVVFEYDNFDVELKNYNYIFTNDKYKDLFIPICKNAMESLNNTTPSKSKKVTRKNKYATKKIIASALVSFMLVGVSYNNLSTSFSFNTDSLTPVTEVTTDLEVKNIVQDNDTQNIEDTVPEVFLENTAVVNENTIFLDYDDRSFSETAEVTSSNYKDIIEKYATMYGLDTNLVLAIATQERGIHSDVMDPGGATGLMQIQNSVWNGASLNAYNFNEKKWDEIVVNENDLSDLNYNVKIGCMILQDYLNHMNYNIPAAVQSYNMGYNCVNSLISQYCSDEGKELNEVLKDQTDIGWLDYRNSVPFGDQNYLEHVLSYCGNGYNIVVKNPNNEEFSITVSGNVKNKKNI